MNNETFVKVGQPYKSINEDENVVKIRTSFPFWFLLDPLYISIKSKCCGGKLFRLLTHIKLTKERVQGKRKGWSEGQRGRQLTSIFYVGGGQQGLH